MDMDTRAERREQKKNKTRHGMKVSGRSVFVIQAAEKKRTDKKAGK